MARFESFFCCGLQRSAVVELPLALASGEIEMILLIEARIDEAAKHNLGNLFFRQVPDVFL